MIPKRCKKCFIFSMRKHDDTIPFKLKQGDDLKNQPLAARMRPDQNCPFENRKEE